MKSNSLHLQKSIPTNKSSDTNKTLTKKHSGWRDGTVGPVGGDFSFLQKFLHHSQFRYRKTMILERSNLSSKSSSGWKFGFYQPNLPPDGLGVVRRWQSWMFVAVLGCPQRAKVWKVGCGWVLGCGVYLWFVIDITILNREYYF